MQSSFINNINELTTAFERNPFSLIAVVLFLILADVIRRITRDIKLEHVFQHTLNNKIRFIKDEIREGIIDELQQVKLKQRYTTLLNQKLYGVKNRRVQQEVINIIDKSDEIKGFKYFAIHQYVLNINSDGRLYFNKNKIKGRIFDGFAFLTIGLSALGLGFFILYASITVGLVVCLLGMILYFAGLSHFPASPTMRKRAEKEIENYYQHRDLSEV